MNKYQIFFSEIVYLVAGIFFFIYAFLIFLDADFSGLRASAHPVAVVFVALSLLPAIHDSVLWKMFLILICCVLGAFFLRFFFRKFD